MKVLLCIAVALVAVYASPAPLPIQDAVIPGEYLVLLRENVGLGPLASLLEKTTIKHDHHIGNKAFLILGDVTEEVATALKSSVLVQSVEENRVVMLDEFDNTPTAPPSQFNMKMAGKSSPGVEMCLSQSEPAGEPSIWHLIRSSHRNMPEYQDYTYDFQHTGAGVNIYILDTGIDYPHPEFQTRARHEFTSSDLVGQGNLDDHGHGTHCASLAGGYSFGIAKGAQLIAVKVLGRFGAGTTGGIIEGINFAHDHAQATGARAIVSMSLGGGTPSEAQREAIEAAIANQVFFIVAAGNSNEDTSNMWPAAWEATIAVGATDRNDVMATFTNYGELNDIHAPGVDTWAAGSQHSNWCNDVVGDCYLPLSGTSMSCPVVAGVAARYLGSRTAGEYAGVTQESLRQMLSLTSSHLVIAMLPHHVDANTPNRLIHREDCP